MIYDFSNFSGKNNLSKKRISPEMFSNIMSPCFGQE